MVQLSFKSFQRVSPFVRIIFLICLPIYIFFQAYLIKMLHELMPINRNPVQQSEDKFILNGHLFGPLRNDSVVIVVQVHNRENYLRQLIKSLERAKGISKVLLIFSHDYIDDGINKLVQQITFCKVLQIFYPRAISRSDQEKTAPDSAKQRMKLHWWWKANYIFDELNVTRSFTGAVVFMEEDHYVTEDFLHVLDLMHQRAPELCPQCKIFSLGTGFRLIAYKLYTFTHVDLEPWVDGWGFAMNRTVWNEIVKYAGDFCTYNDYNWDWTLRYISEQRMPSVLLSMKIVRPRVFHIGSCGVHFNKKNCDSNELVSEIEKLHKHLLSVQKMYPETLIMRSSSSEATTSRTYGSWENVKDHQLCLSFTRQRTLDTTINHN